MPRIRELRIARIDRRTVDLVGPPAIVPEDGNDLGYVLAQRLLVRLPVIPCVDSGEDLLVAVTEVREAEEEEPAFRGGEAAPFL